MAKATLLLALNALVLVSITSAKGYEVIGDHLVEFPKTENSFEFEFNNRRVLRSNYEASLTPSCITRSNVKAWVAKEDDIDKQLEKFNQKRAEIAVASTDINWDGGAVTDLIGENGLGELPPDLFLNNVMRQVVFNPPLIASDNGFLNVTNEDVGLPAFSPEVNVATLDTNEVTVHFTLPDRITSAMINGFGVIFTDVEKSESSGIRFYDQGGDLLLTVWAPEQKSGKPSFVGAIFDETIVASVVIVLGDNGNVDFSEGNEMGGDFVAMDDWFFFLADTEVPTTSFRGLVNDRDDEEILLNFDRRRDAVFPGSRANINWDGAGVTQQTNGGTALLDRELFLNLAQLTIFAPGERGFASEDQFETNVGLNPLTAPVTFAPQDGNTLTLDFFEANLTTPGEIHGFGAIFTDVEVPNKSGIRCFDKNNEEICNVRARPGESGAHQFVGIMFARPVIARIILDMGDNDSLGTEPENPRNDGPDHVATDDWLFLTSG